MKNEGAIGWECGRMGRKNRRVLMAAYFIVEIEVDDPVVYEEYRVQAAELVTKYGGRYLVRGGATEYIEGGWEPQRLVVLEFADAEQFHRWYDSPEYQEVIKLRVKSTRTRAVMVQGV